MTTQPQPLLSWNHNPPPRPRYIYGRIIADCVDCGEETWWLRGRSTDGGNSVRMEAEAGRSYRVGHLLSNDPDLPITDEPRCPDCTALAAYRRCRGGAGSSPSGLAASMTTSASGTAALAGGPTSAATVESGRSIMAERRGTYRYTEGGDPN